MSKVELLNHYLGRRFVPLPLRMRIRLLSCSHLCIFTTTDNFVMWRYMELVQEAEEYAIYAYVVLTVCHQEVHGACVGG